MIGILGGTFDPIHYGHLRPAEQVLHALQLKEVRLIPAGRPPHRAAPVASAENRLKMAELAVTGRAGLCVDDREIRSSGPSYTVCTLGGLRAELGSQSLCLLIGMDAFVEIESWFEWKQLFEFAHLVVMERPGSPKLESVSDLPEWARRRVCDNEAALMRESAGKIVFQAVDPQPISATAIRRMISKGHCPQGLIPDSVWSYIRTNHLYGYREE
ncbi:MAG: nicotinate-nucleotide adenylyltransferase [Acidiferrobacterales bacterium]